MFAVKIAVIRCQFVEVFFGKLVILFFPDSLIAKFTLNVPCFIFQNTGTEGSELILYALFAFLEFFIFSPPSALAKVVFCFPFHIGSAEVAVLATRK